MSRIVDEKDYAKGFNLGYQLAELSPEISSIINEISSKDDRIFGMQHGIEQYNLELNLTKDLVKNATPAWLRDDRLENLDSDMSNRKEQTNDKDKGIEPEID